VREVQSLHGLGDVARLFGVELYPAPFETAQKPQWRVQTSPPIMKVAVRSVQHSKMFGQRAS
jgi:hypothetical protein